MTEHNPIQDGVVDKKTPLYEEHVRLHGRMVPFAGFVMPIQYSGIIEEHRAVRHQAGIFDLSHMGELRVSGPDAIEAVDKLVTNDIRGLAVGQVRYTPMCFPDGGMVDDLLVYQFQDSLLLVVNASNIEKDFAWIRDNIPDSVAMEDESDETALIAVQGPEAEGIVQALTDTDLASIPYYHFESGRVSGIPVVLSRTGYTGEPGFEIYVASAHAVPVWSALVESGAPLGMKPVGLGARDTLRLEAGYMLYGNDIDQNTTPLEAGLGWTVKFGDADFIGRAALESQKSGGLQRRIVAIEMQDRAIPRPHFPLYSGDACVGQLTSGTFSPSFEKGIGLGYVAVEAAKPGTALDVEVRRDRHPARVVRKPMYKREGA